MKRIRKSLIFVLGIVTLICLCACTKQSQQKNGLSVVTSFYPVYSITKAVSGDLNDIKMIRSQSGIHGFEPLSSDVAAIYDADLFLYHSHTLEAWARRLEPSLHHSKVSVIEASKGMTLDKVHGLEDVEAEKGVDESTLYDPHTWNDPVKVSEEAQLIATQLAKKDPKNAKVYQKNADQFSDKAMAIAEKYKPKFKAAKSKYFVTSHTAFSYLAKRYGLTQLGIAGVSTEQEPSAKKLAEIQEFVKTYKVKTIFVEEGVSPKLAQAVASATRVKIASLSPLEAVPKNNKDYLENLETNLKVLVKSLNQ
ncbi:TPA: zinc ABC transporter substrate-binding protein [Streptococcus agalactiae]|nr:zinc ABC transporter substrate-binding protein [Streptococcus agalactiae]